jgi:hypothetical protein
VKWCIVAIVPQKGDKVGAATKAKMSAAKRRHGHSPKGKSTRIYQVWVAMRQRCENPNHKNYDLYGGRGICVCWDWGRFENFLADMGEKPNGLTLDRINPDGNYEPGNCRWATWHQQRINRSKNPQR